MLRVLKPALAFFLLASLPLFAETSQNEIATSWLIDPVAQNWTCSPDPNLPPVPNCYAVNPKQYAFVGVEAVPVQKLVNGVLTSRMYFYTESWGPIAGASSECAGDNISLFETPYTHAGVRGSGVIYRGTVRPCNDGHHWAVHSAFKDDSLNGIFITAGRAPDGSTFKELMVGKSFKHSSEDDGIVFTWSQLVTTALPGLDILNTEVRPHPTQPKVWWGFFTFDNHNDASFFAMVPMKIDWNNNTFQYKTGPSTWTSIPIGGAITVLPYSELPSGADSLTYVRGRWELWVDGTTATQLPPRSGVVPCGFPANPQPTSLYTANMLDASRVNQGGSSASYYVVTPDFVITGPRPLTSKGPNGVSDYGTPASDDVRPNPADYGMAFVNAHRVDVPASSWGLYTGSQDNTICTYNIVDWHPWSGSGIRFTRLEDR